MAKQLIELKRITPNIRTDPDTNPALESGPALETTVTHVCLEVNI